MENIQKIGSITVYGKEIDLDKTPIDELKKICELLKSRKQVLEQKYGSYDDNALKDEIENVQKSYIFIKEAIRRRELNQINIQFEKVKIEESQDEQEKENLVRNKKKIRLSKQKGSRRYTGKVVDLIKASRDSAKFHLDAGNTEIAEGLLKSKFINDKLGLNQNEIEESELGIA